VLGVDHLQLLLELAAEVLEVHGLSWFYEKILESHHQDNLVGYSQFHLLHLKFEDISLLLWCLRRTWCLSLLDGLLLLGAPFLRYRWSGCCAFLGVHLLLLEFLQNCLSFILEALLHSSYILYNFGNEIHLILFALVTEGNLFLQGVSECFQILNGALHQLLDLLIHICYTIVLDERAFVVLVELLQVLLFDG